VLSPHSKITVVSPQGGHAVVDPFSVSFAADDKISMDFFHNHKDVWEKTERISDYLGRANEFDAVFVPGGHGPVQDLYKDEYSIQLLAEFADAGKIVSAVCHGPAAFVNVKTKDGQPLVAGARVTSCTDKEEIAFGTHEGVPFMLETELRKQAAKFENAPELWGAHVVVDRGGKLITGQNPASAAGVAEAMLKYM
jgi:putative intracellular protease/amidase